MPKQVKTKIGDIYHVETVQTGFEKFIERLQALGAVIFVGVVVLVILSAIFG